MKNEINEAIKRISIELDNLSKSNNQTINIKFNTCENNIFLIETINNGISTKKINLNVQPNYLSFIYQGLYNFFKTNYLKSNTNYISIFESVNLENPNNSFLQLIIKNIHQNNINIKLNDNGYEREIINFIKNDWINILESASKNKKI